MSICVNPEGICTIEQMSYPAVGFGTNAYKGIICEEAVAYAIEAGFRIFDTATFYENLIPIGKILKKQDRSAFYIISKAWHDAQTPDRLRKDLEGALEKLQTHYLDAYLLHWPNSQVPIEETLAAMEAAKKEGLLRHIGLSNVTVNHLKRALEVNIPISWVQVEMNPAFYDAELLDFCKNNAIAFQAWAPFGRGRLKNDPLLFEIAKKHGKITAQIALKWCLQHGVLPLSGSTNPKHMRQNLQITDFSLSSEEMNALDTQAQKGERERVAAERGFGFTDEFDFSYEECWPRK